MKLQRTGLTEGSLIFNQWLKTKGLYREDTENEFINWLYSTSGFYDKDIKGTYFDIDVEAVKKSVIYQRFLQEFHDSLLNSDTIHLMIHGAYHLNGQELQGEFAKRFAPVNFCFWKDFGATIKEITEHKRVLVVSSIAQQITDKYWTPENKLLGYSTPTTHLNNGPHKNYFETLDQVTKDVESMKDQFDVALVSFGAYGCPLVDKICSMGKSAATIGSGIYEAFPVGSVPVEKRPTGWKKIEDGRYWK